MLPQYLIHEIQKIKDYLRIIDGNFISSNLYGVLSKGWVKYRNPEQDWYHSTFFPQLKSTGLINNINIDEDGYLRDFLDSYTEEYRVEFSEQQSEVLLKQIEEKWKVRVLPDYSREEHIKRLIWAIADGCEESMRVSIENYAQKFLSPNQNINFREFWAEGMFFEVVCHNSPRKTSADLRDVRLKAFMGIWGNVYNYEKRKPCLPNKPFLRIPTKIYKPGLGWCKIVGLSAGVFDYLSEVEILEMPNTLKQVEWSLWHCRKLKEIRIINSYDVDGFKTIDGVLFSGDLKTLVAYPNNHGAEYKVPEGVEIIANKAFKDCLNLRKLMLPSSLKSIGLNAFYRCENLELITMNKSEGTIDYKGLFGNYGNVNPRWEYLNNNAH